MLFAVYGEAAQRKLKHHSLFVGEYFVLALVSVDAIEILVQFFEIQPHLKLPQLLDLLLDKLDRAVVAVLRVVRAQLVVEAAALLLVQGLVASESLRSR